MAIDATMISRTLYLVAGNLDGDPQRAVDKLCEQTSQLLATFETCDDGDCGALLALLQTQMERQAHAEVEWLRVTGDPEAARHRREHEFWLDVVDVMQQRLGRGDVRTVRWMAADLEHRCKTHALWFGSRARSLGHAETRH